MPESHHTPAPAAFHAGEVALQREAGVAERMARHGLFIRDHLPEQHRDFYPLLPFIIVGSVDPNGMPSASLLAAAPGFAWSPNPTRLHIDALPAADDPLDANLRRGAAIGLLGIQPHTRRRNRLNGHVTDRDESGFALSVDQAFGNCPKYIHPRELVFTPRQPSPASISPTLGPAQRAHIASADTFFLATAHPEATASSSAPAHGVDVSHRGGPPGFLHFTSEDTLIIPDYRGNNFYNTLGNLHLAPHAGLLFLDPQTGDLLQLSTRVDITHGDHPLANRDATGRILRFHITEVRAHPRGAQLGIAAG
jgi:uncharacterized protein